MEDKAINKPTMVSRLPKFGVRPEAGVASLRYGSGQSAPNSEGKSTGQKKPSVMMRIPSFSLKWKKEGPGTPPSPEENFLMSETDEGNELGQCLQQKSINTRQIKKPTLPATTVQRHVLTAATTKTKPVPVVSKVVPQPAVNQTPSEKLSMNGVSGNRAKVRAGSALPRPRASSGSARTGSRDSLSQANDSPKSLQPDPMVRSQSFTHFSQSSSQTAPPMTRSFSFNKAVELSKPLSSLQRRTPMPLLKPGLAVTCGRGSTVRVTVPSNLTTPAGNLKKSLFPACVLSRPSALGFRMPRPSLVHMPRPLLAGKDCVEATLIAQDMDSMETPMVTSDTLNEGTLAPESQSEGGPGPREKALSTPCLGDRLEDMSLSSASSLEHNDTSEEYQDDFDLGDCVGTLLLPVHEARPLQPQPSSNVNVPDNRLLGAATQTHPSGILLDDQAGGKEDLGVSVCPAPLSLSPEADIPPASSLELSPSNSSGGTYMWDEEGLEMLDPPVPHCGSCDSDVNGMDILNNLGSSDLDDNDLMLDADLPGDGCLHSDADGMSQSERTERSGRQGHWRRRQHRWTGPDRYHNDNRNSGFQSWDGYPGPGIGRVGQPSQKPSPRPDGHMVGLDESLLRDMAQDCSSVKSQLLRLKNLLQMDDGVEIHHAGVSEALSSEASEDVSPAIQVEELMREVQELKEELRSKEKTISHLTQQLSVRAELLRCQCQQRSPAPRFERRARHDKGTQTPWRGQAGAPPAPFKSPWQGQYQGNPRAGVPHRRQTSNTTVFQTSLPQRAPPLGKAAKNSPHRGPQ